MKMTNMCLVLKSDNGKVVSIANEQNHRVRQTESCQHPAPYYNIDLKSGFLYEIMVGRKLVQQRLHPFPAQLTKKFRHLI